MSTVTTPLNNSNSQFNNYDITNIFVLSNRYDSANFTNDTYESITLTMGSVVGRVNSTDEIALLTSGASDGSQFPIGILAETITVLAGVTASLSFCVDGDVATSQLLFQGSDVLTTVIDGKTLRDRIGSDTVGVNLVGGTELTAFDNQ